MSLGNAIGYLTPLRVPPRRQVPLPYSLHYFPLIGAAIGSLCILFFLGASRFLPNLAACLLTVLLAQFLAGWGQWRGVAEAIQGGRTYPGYGFRPGFRLDRRGTFVLLGLLVLKTASLAVMSLDWQTRAVFVFPILGHCARTAAFLMGPVKGLAGGALLRRRRVRAGCLCGVLLFLVFLFPLRVALPLLAVGGFAVWRTLKTRNAQSQGLTLQTASVASELAECLFLAAPALASFFV